MHDLQYKNKGNFNCYQNYLRPCITDKGLHKVNDLFYKLRSETAKRRRSFFIYDYKGDSHSID